MKLDMVNGHVTAIAESMADVEQLLNLISGQGTKKHPKLKKGQSIYRSYGYDNKAKNPRATGDYVNGVMVHKSVRRPALKPQIPRPCPKCNKVVRGNKGMAVHWRTNHGNPTGYKDYETIINS